MIVDTSALVSILLSEPDAPYAMDVLTHSVHVRISAATLVETYIVAQSKFPHKTAEEAMMMVDNLIQGLNIEVIPFTAAQARLAGKAFATYGRGRHEAKLNFGDCLSYAAAKERGEDLLFKGHDFSATDLGRE